MFISCGKTERLFLWCNEYFRLLIFFLLQLEEPDEGCIRPSEDVYCFLAGDPRVNEQTVHPLHHSHSLSSMEE